MNAQRPLLLLLLTWSLLAAGSAVAGPATDLVRTTTDRVLATLDAHRSEVEDRPSAVYGLVREILVPHFDFEVITRAAVGRPWLGATPAQRSTLIASFRELLLRTYAKALSRYTGEQIRYLPETPGSRPGTVVVSTSVIDPGSDPVPILYRLYQRGGRWLVYDVIISEVSLVTNYRGSFAAQLREGGIDGLIRKLEALNQAARG